MNDNTIKPMTYLSDSGWVDRPSKLTPPVSGDVSCEVAVIGGGLGGMSAALRLAELGKDVVLIEAGMCGWGASARNAGYVTPTVGSKPWVLDRFYRDKIRDLNSFANTAVAFTEDFIDRHGIECDYEQTGFVAASHTRASYERLRSTAKSGRRSTVGSAEEIGIPPAFYGGVHVKVGGALNPGKFALGVRKLVLDSRVRVFEQTPVQRVTDNGDSVSLEVPDGSIRAAQTILTVNAFSNQLGIAPRFLVKPIWITAVETEPISPERLDAAGWTSRLPLLTTHNIMQSFRTTAHGSIVNTTRKLKVSRRARRDEMPSHAVVSDLIRGFHERFPTLPDVSSVRAWGGWVGETPSNIAVAGQASPNVCYSLACNGHGLPQAPYVGMMLAEYLENREMPSDLQAIWRGSGRFMPGIIGATTLQLGWVADRAMDLLDRRHSSRGRS